MKVLFVNTPKAPEMRGGDLTQMRQTAAALQPLGVDVGESFDREPDARGYDLAHVFNLRTLDVTPGQVKHLKQFGIPVAMSPIYMDMGLAAWGRYIVPFAFDAAKTDDELTQLLSGVAARRLKARKPDGKVYAADSTNRSWADHDAKQAATVALVDHLLPNSLLEMDRLVKVLRVHGKPFTVVPYAADPKVFLDPDPEPFVAEHGLRDFVLQVGRIELSKNPLMLARALRDAGLPLVLIGGQLMPGYRDFCQKHGPRDMRILPHLPPEQLRSAYAAARVHALPSWIETCGLVTMEAALANCSVVASTAGFELEYYRDLAYYCDPADIDSIRTAVVSAYQNYDRDANRRAALKSLILREYSWDRAAALTKSAYERMLAA